MLLRIQTSIVMTLSIAKLNIMTLIKMKLDIAIFSIVTLRIMTPYNDTQHKQY
jgi:hypothetical protein